MLDLSTSNKAIGQLPSPLVLDDILNRELLSSMAEKIYDTEPNLVALLKTDKGPVVVKLFGWRHPLHYYLSPTFPSRAQASWETAQALINAGSRTPKPLFVYTRRVRGFIQENVYITQAIYPHQHLRSFLMSEGSIDILKTAIADLALSIARMHNTGIFHRDLTTGNFLVNKENKVFIVDLNRAQQLKKLSIHQRLTDLAKLYFKTREEALEEVLVYHFFEIYTDICGLNIDLITGYKEYRKSLLSHRELKKRLRRIVRGK